MKLKRVANSIYRRDGARGRTWTIIYYVDKKQIWRGGFRTQKKAKAELTSRTAKIAEGTWQELRKIGFRDLAEKWLHDYATLTVKAGTLRSYASGVRKWLVPFFDGQPAASIRPQHVQAFLAHATQATSGRGRPLSAKSANNALVLLKEVLQQGKRWGFLRENPAAEIKPARTEHREMDFYTTAEVRVLLSDADGIARPLLMVAILTGMRRNEILALRWGDLDWQAGQIRVRQQLFKLTRKEAGNEDRWRFPDLKSRYSRRAIDMTPELRDALELHRLSAPIGHRDLVFCRADGEPLDPEGMVDREFTATARRVGLRVIRFHDLRHTYAALQIAAGASPKYLQAQMGHSSIKVTLDLYGHLMPDVEREAARRLGTLVFGPSPQRSPAVAEPLPPKNDLRNVAQTTHIKRNEDKRPAPVTH